MKRSLPKKKLLVIDDDPAVLFAFRKLFGKSDFQVDTSESFDEAKKFIDKNIYQLIITDLGFSETINEAGIAISQYARKNRCQNYSLDRDGSPNLESTPGPDRPLSHQTYHPT